MKLIKLPYETITVYDLETTRPNPVDPQIEIIQFAAATADSETLVLIDGTAIDIKIKFDLEKADPESIKVNSYDPDIWAKQAIPQNEAAWKINAYFGGRKTWKRISRKGKFGTVCKLMGFNNASFDDVVLRRMLDANGIAWPAASLWPTGTIDVMHMAQSIDMLEGNAWSFYSLSDMCDRYGIDNEDAHDALADVKATLAVAKVYKEKLAKLK